MRVNYGWDTTRTDWLIRIFLSGGPPRAVHFDSSYSVEVYIFGDGSGTQFRFALDDRVPIAAAGNHEVSPWYSIDWTGWRLVTWRPSIDGIGSWIGDGSLDGTLRFDSIQLTYKPGAADRGTVYLDDLRIVKRTASPVATEHEEIPGRFSLRQNYPNPFNSSTRILVELPTMTSVTLKIYDATGSEVSTLIAGSTLTSGTHEIVWRAAEEGLPSGVYFARLEANGMSRVIQMVLLR